MGVAGEPTGVSIIDGRPQSEPTRGRPWFAIDNRGRVEAALNLSSDAVAPSLVWSDGTTTMLDGINRRPELLRDCGALLEPVAQLAWHDHTCLLPDQLVALNYASGFIPVRYQNALYALVQADGSMRESHAAPSADELLLIATGRQVDVLRGKIAAGNRARLFVPAVAANPALAAVGGAPTLLKDGAKYRSEPTEGWPFAAASLDQANIMHRWVNLKNPRTALGVRADGTILLVVVDGRRHDKPMSPMAAFDGGASIEELRDVMLSLGAVDAMNLDGGGSSTLVINGEIANYPSDLAGERPIGDALIVVQGPK